MGMIIAKEIMTIFKTSHIKFSQYLDGETFGLFSFIPRTETPTI